MSQQSVRQAARRSALDAQAVLRKERADRERRLEALAVAVLTALGERDALVRDAEQRAGQALRTMTDDEGLSVREAVDWCGSGVTVREITRLLRLDGDHQAVKRTRRMSGRPGRLGAALHDSATVRASGRSRCGPKLSCGYLVMAALACTPRDWRTVLAGPVIRRDAHRWSSGVGASGESPLCQWVGPGLCGASSSAAMYAARFSS